MKYFAKIIFLILIIVSVPNLLWSQNNEYRILLNASNSKEYKVYDTLATLDFLSLKKETVGMNIQDFEGFNYPKLDLQNDGELTILQNDSIKITLTTIDFDSAKFQEEFTRNSSIRSSSLYFRESLAEFDYPPFFPSTEISRIEISTSGNTKALSKEQLFDLYNPDLRCWTFAGTELCGLNGYVTENGEILVTLICGEGAAASKVIFVFNSDGSMKRKLSLPVI